MALDQHVDRFAPALTKVATLRWQASRAVGATWMATVLSTLRLLHDADVLACLDITLPLEAPGLGPSDTVDDDGSEQSRLELFFRFLYELGASRCWSQIQFSMLCPQFLAAIWHESMDVRAESLARARDIWKAVLAAEDVVYEKPDAPQESERIRKPLKKCLDDMGWNSLQIARESYSVARAAEWSPGDSQLRQLAHKLFARPCTTKHFLEDAFAHISDIAKRHMKGQTMQRSLGSECTHK